MTDDSYEKIENELRATKHAECEDGWYSCPLCSEGCVNPNEGTDCTCGTSRIHELADRLAALRASRPDMERVIGHLAYKYVKLDDTQAFAEDARKLMKAYLAPPEASRPEPVAFGVSVNMLNRWKHLDPGSAAWTMTAFEIHQRLNTTYDVAPVEKWDEHMRVVAENQRLIAENAALRAAPVAPATVCEMCGGRKEVPDHDIEMMVPCPDCKTAPVADAPARVCETCEGVGVVPVNGVNQFCPDCDAGAARKWRALEASIEGARALTPRPDVSKVPDREACLFKTSPRGCDIAAVGPCQFPKCEAPIAPPMSECDRLDAAADIADFIASTSENEKLRKLLFAAEKNLRAAALLVSYDEAAKR